ncbi:hypothetical protein S83_031437 [Arachis hypogaea]|nr:uncharacterized protein DS421_10g294600 [Arachis hypogaea]
MPLVLGSFTMRDSSTLSFPQGFQGELFFIHHSIFLSLFCFVFLSQLYKFITVLETKMLVCFQKQNNGGKEAAAVDVSPSMRQWSYFYLQASHFLRSQVLSSTRRRIKKLLNGSWDLGMVKPYTYIVNFSGVSIINLLLVILRW